MTCSRSSVGLSGVILQCKRLFHGMHTEHIPFAVDGQSDEAVLADGHLLPEDAPSGGSDATGFGRAIGAKEVDDCAIAAGWHAFLTSAPAAPKRSISIGKLHISIFGESSFSSLVLNTD